MKILSLGEIPELQKMLLPLGYQLHVSDACGGQAFRLEKLENAREDKVYPVLESFFSQRRMELSFFGKDRLSFTIRP